MSDDPHKDWQLKVAGQLGSIDSTLQAISARMSGLETKVEHIGATVNRWKGATAIVGMVFGGLLTYFLKLFTGAGSDKI